MTRRLATWSFALLVIGAAIVDTTLLSRPPKQQQANVEQAPTSVEKAPHVLGANEPRPQNRIDVDGETGSIPRLVTLFHRSPDGGMPVELRAPGGCSVQVDGLQAAPAPLRVFFPDGSYVVTSSCGALVSLGIQTDRAGSR